MTTDGGPRTRTLTVEAGIYLVIALIALAFRLYHLGEAPLTAAEAREALAAWRFTSPTAGSAPILPESPAWFTLTSLAFLLFGATDAWARFWPALVGAALTLVPASFRRELGRPAALMASGLLAVSPVMMASARTADGTALAGLSLWLVAIGLRSTRETADGGGRVETHGMAIAGLGLGLGLASGPRFISAVAAAMAAALFVTVARPAVIRDARLAWGRIRPGLGPMLLAAGASFVLFASAGLVNRPGLSAAGAAVPIWLGGWMVTRETQPIELVPQALLVYELLPVVLGLGGFYVAFLSPIANQMAAALQSAVRLAGDAEANDSRRPAAEGEGWEGAARVLVAASLGAAAFGLAYTGRQASDAMWAVVPLAMLAGKVLAAVFFGPEGWLHGEWQTVTAQAGVLLVMLIFSYLNLAEHVRSPVVILNAQAYPNLRLILAIAVTALGVLVTILFAAGWSKIAAIRGAVLALGTVLLIGTIGSAWKLTQTLADDPRELWRPEPTARNIRLLVQTVREISNRTVGDDADLDITVLKEPGRTAQSAALDWELRGFTKARYVDALSATIRSPVVIADASVTDPVLGSAYLGQRFAVVGRRLPAPFSTEEWIGWWLFRQGQVEYAHQVLWVRQDVQTLAGSR